MIKGNDLEWSVDVGIYSACSISTKGTAGAIALDSGLAAARDPCGGPECMVRVHHLC